QEFADEATVRHFQEAYAAGTLRYSELKPAVADAVVRALPPIRARREELVAHPDRVPAAPDASATRASPPPPRGPRHDRGPQGAPPLPRRAMDVVRLRLGLR